MSANRQKGGRRRRRVPTSRSKKVRGTPRPRRAVFFYARHLALWTIIVFLGYWLWVDREVAQAFENKRWSLPARVFARPLELYPEAEVSKDRLSRALTRLGYEPVDVPRSRGQFSMADNQLEVMTRGFPYWDMPEPGRRALISFADDRVHALVDVLTAQSIDLMRLEPPEIGRINPRRYEDRTLLVYDDIPRSFIDALVAVEDRRYFTHVGVDLKGLARAMWANLRAAKFVQGGSTLTQQLIKNLYLTRDRTLVRKFNEILMALSLERRYSKEEILETYMNEVFLGQDGNRAIHGFELAAHFYFAKPLAELQITEAATLIGMIKGPSVFDPRRNLEAARDRRNVVLTSLADYGILDKDDARRLHQQPVTIHGRTRRRNTSFPAFMGLVKRQLLRDYSARDLNAAGLNIFTTLDMDVQLATEQAVRDTISALESESSGQHLQAAAILAEPASGEILAMVGDRNPAYAGFNRVLDARRPVGSIIKPFIYALALEQPRQYSLLTKLEDKFVSWTDAQGGVWEPKNFNGREHGDVRMLDALVRSLNLATVNLGMQLGVSQVANYLEQLGIKDDVPEYPAILLGAIDLSPFEVTELYTIIANDGFRVPLRAISAVTDQSQSVLNRYGLKIKPVMKPAAASLVRYAMTQVIAQGTGRRLPEQIARIKPLAGKTGTTNDHRDSWFAGFGSNRLGIVWVGRDDNQPTGLTGASGALQIWGAAMRRARLQALKTSVPPEVHWQRVELNTNTIVGAECSGGVLLPLHEQSTVNRAASCDGHAVEIRRRRGVIDRIRDFFR